jgi:DNA-binding Lrp family transcriptional regulator
MKLSGFIIAVRFVRSYGLEDNLGSLMDHILKNPDKTFNEKLFPEYKPYYDARLLIDTKKDNKLTLNSENIVLEINSSNNFEKDFNDFLEAYDKIIVKEIFKEYGIVKIDRFGCVLKSTEKDYSELYKDIEAVLKKHDKHADSLSVRFNCVKKTPKTIKNFITTDYENQIISYDRKTLKDDLNLFVDYQKYFQPALEKISDADISFTDFCKSSLRDFKDQYLNKK